MNRLERANAVVEEILNSAKLSDEEFEELMNLVLKKGKAIVGSTCRDNTKYNVFIPIEQSELSFPIVKLNNFECGNIKALSDAYVYVGTMASSSHITLVIVKELK